MKKNIITLLFVISFVPLSYALIGVSGTVYTDGVGRYLWRGQILDNNTSIQPGLSLSINKISLDWWGSYSAESNRLIESDYKVSAGDSLPLLPMTGVETGFWIYTMPYNPASSNHSVEIYGSFSLDIPTQPYVSFYYGGMTSVNGYVEAGISQDVELFGFGLSASLNAGYNFGQDNYSPSLTALTGTFGASYSIAGLKITPAFTGQLALDSQYMSLGTWKVSVSYDFGGEEESVDDVNTKAE
ncbi:MAG: hypothetical protein LLG37_02670 [Spirochaetia bacterium]|nr:hypothetical protein [Spirochaetia bacterium]